MNLSKRLTVALALAALLATGLPALAERADDTNRASKNGLTEGTIDGVEVTLEYGRPNVKDRKIWGGLVPFGKIWRTGADEATTFSVSRDVTIEGQALEAGTYALFTTPGESEWSVHFNTQAEQWGVYNRDASLDALVVQVAPAEAEHVESMTFEIGESSVVLRWEKLAVAFGVAAAE
jgi:hypothetical protein